MVQLTPRAIDLHAHFLPERYRASALAHGQSRPDGMPALPEWSAAAAVPVSPSSTHQRNGRRSHGP